MAKQLLHLVFGGELTALNKVEFRDLSKVHFVGVFPNFASARDAWKSLTRPASARGNRGICEGSDGQVRSTEKDSRKDRWKGRKTGAGQVTIRGRIVWLTPCLHDSFASLLRCLEGRHS
jgi:hypothetical protein